MGSLSAFAEYVRQNRIPVITSGLMVSLMVLPVTAFTFITGDDWLFIFDPRGRLEWYYGIGRIGPDYVRNLLAPIISPHYSLALYVGGLIVCAVTLAFLFRISKAVHIVLFILLFVMFPLHLENMYYKDNHVPLAVAFIAASAYLILLFGAVQMEWKPLVVLVALLLCTILIHQSTAIFIVTAFLGVWVVNSYDLPSVKLPAALLGLSAAITAPLYVAIVAYHQTLVERWPIPKEYLLLESLNRTPSEFIASFQVFAIHVWQFLFRGQHLVPVAIKILFLFMLGFVIFDILRRKAALSLILLVALLATPWTLGLVRNSWTTYKYTAIGLPLAIIYPTTFLLYVRSAPERSVLARGGLIAVTVAILIFFQALSNVTFAARITSERDMAITQRLLSDIEAAIREEGLSIDSNHAIVIDAEPILSMYDNGPPFNGLIGPEPMARSSMLCGLYACDVTKIPMALRLLDMSHGGKRFYFLGAQQYAWNFKNFNPVSNAEGILKELSRWPRKGSLRVVGHTVFVKLGE